MKNLAFTTADGTYIQVTQSHSEGVRLYISRTDYEYAPSTAPPGGNGGTAIGGSGSSPKMTNKVINCGLTKEEWMTLMMAIDGCARETPSTAQLGPTGNAKNSTAPSPYDADKFKY